MLSPSSSPTSLHWLEKVLEFSPLLFSNFLLHETLFSVKNLPDFQEISPTSCGGVSHFQEDLSHLYHIFLS